MIVRVRDFFCFARLVDVLIPIDSFSYDTGETEVCPHDIKGEALKVHPRLFCLSIKLAQMCLHDLPSSTILCPRDLVPGWSSVWEELLEEKPTESSGGCGVFTTAKDPEYFAAFCHFEM